MRLRVGCTFEHDAVDHTPAVVMVDPHSSVAGQLLEQRFTTEPAVAATHFDDLYGNRCRRLLPPPGASRFSYDAVYAISPESEPTTAAPHAIASTKMRPNCSFQRGVVRDGSAKISIAESRPPTLSWLRAAIMR